jgi:valyl-tRNA synthetase
MLMMGLLLTDKMAFSTIYLHGIIRDENGLKQSKSLGNGIDPLTIIDQYGCDSLRWALAENNSAGQDQRLSDEKFDSAKRFGNKIWQASRFMLMNWNRIGNPTITEPTPIHADDCQLYGELMACRSEMNEALLEMDFRKAAHAFRHFFHGRFCDWWIEAAKPRMRDGDELCCLMGMWALKECLKMLHPFMPYRSERIWQAIESTPLILQQW